MQDRIEQNSVSFHGRARSEFFPLYQEFKQSIRQLDRQKDENVYQQLLIRYVNQLRHRLENIALEMLEHIDYAHRNKLNQMLRSGIEEYIQEFMQKARSL